jgi:hypothetical protein
VWDETTASSTTNSSHPPARSRRQGPFDGRRHPPARRDHIDQELIDRARVLARASPGLLERFGGIEGLAERGLVRGEDGNRRVLFGVTNVERLEGCWPAVRPAEFLSPYGLRAVGMAP